jgi:hypothetical protein
MGTVVTTIVDCGHGNNSGNTYTVDANGCITIVRSTTVGYNLDTICVVQTNPVTGISDTTRVIVSNLAACPDLIRDTTIACSSPQGGGLCIPLTLNNIQAYHIFVDGTRSAQQFSSQTGCGQALVDAGYNFSVVDYVDNVSHLLEEYGVDATHTYNPNINFNNLTELAAYMNSVDAAGAWYVDGMNIKTANPDVRYRNGSGIQFFSMNPEAATYTVRYNDKVTYTGSLLSLTSGCHKVVLVDTVTGCVDSANVCVEGGCILPSTEHDTGTIGTTTTHCVQVDTSIHNGVTTIENCGHANNSGNVYSVDTTGCITIVRSTTVGANLDTICVVTCDSVSHVCDTTRLIVTNLPRVDTIRDTGIIRTTATVCMPLNPGMTPATTSIFNCGHTNNSGNIYTVGTNGCITITRSDVTGYSIDTLCVAVCNASGICDTTIVIVSNTPVKTIIPDTCTVGCTTTVCTSVPVGMTIHTTNRLMWRHIATYYRYASRP